MANPSASAYNADAIEVLSGLDPVRKRPGMYTDTSRPNHLAQEVIDNSVDEALAGHAKSIQVILHEDNSLEVLDDGRGMPVDIHPEEGVPGVELILTKLHAGGKFSNKNYQFSGGLHGVGISVVNALSTSVIVTVKRDGNEYQMSFADGYKASDLTVVGTVGKRNTGTSVHFWPDAKYFDSFKFSVSRLKHVLKAKAVLCPGLAVSFEDKASGEKVAAGHGPAVVAVEDRGIQRYRAAGLWTMAKTGHRPLLIAAAGWHCQAARHRWIWR